jgi:hypothetical protein
LDLNQTRQEGPISAPESDDRRLAQTFFFATWSFARAHGSPTNQAGTNLRPEGACLIVHANFLKEILMHAYDMRVFVYSIRLELPAASLSFFRVCTSLLFFIRNTFF